jgi:membrane protease YdiL (CAAX protease family)
MSHLRQNLIKASAGVTAVFALFHGLATYTGSDRGQAGIAIAIAVVVTLIAIEAVFFGRTPAEAMRALGFGTPDARGFVAVTMVAILLLATVPLYAFVRGVPLTAYPDWPWLLPGLFAQAGIAEEVLFRGYLFRHLREGRSFWHAAMLAAVPFVIVHLILFATMPWPIALAAVLLSTIISFPLARLFELGGNTIWAPAILHFVVQGTVKVVEAPGDIGLPIAWMAASMTIPWLVFLSARR